MLSGILPDWIGSHLHDLEVLGLEKNEFNGVIPHTFCQLSHLRVMNLAKNKLTGDIPNCFGHLLGMRYVRGGFYVGWVRFSFSQVLKGSEQEYTSTRLYPVNFDFSSNNLVGEIPWELTNLSGLIGLNLSHNHLRGKIPTNIGDLKQLESLDFSSNCLHGGIPESLSDLDFIQYLNLSRYHLSGPIPTRRHFQTLEDPSIYAGNPELLKNIGDLKQLESLDFSSNCLHGGIPESLSDLDFLQYLNLSRNHLSGPIPTGRHFQTLEDPSIYAGNPELCGALLPKKCHEDRVSNPPMLMKMTK